MKITKYPQSCFLLEYKGKNILIDPGTYCYNDNFQPADWPKIDILLLTHKHSDHCYPEAVKIINGKSRPVIVTNQECNNLLREVDNNLQIINPGEELVVKDIKIRSIKQKHGPLPSGAPEPDVIGFLIDDIFYHPGDTLNVENKPWAKVVAVPICGTVVMTPDEAAKFIKEIKPELVIPMHYHNPKYITDPNLFVEAIRDSDIQVKVLSDGENVEIN